ncbi:hypothetical protein Q1695_008020 [Nippostrongylus brasiliensis]|nr:hypothetical protein Q1695_008020 [Nippostrongylus brasiliensis]
MCRYGTILARLYNTANAPPALDSADRTSSEMTFTPKVILHECDDYRLALKRDGTLKYRSIEEDSGIRTLLLD